MPRPMTTYRSGIVTRRVHRTGLCRDCLRTFTEWRRFEGIAAVVDADVDAWRAALPERCSTCRTRARRAA